MFVITQSLTLLFLFVFEKNPKNSKNTTKNSNFFFIVDAFVLFLVFSTSFKKN
jgi:hypothetical protein